MPGIEDAVPRKRSLVEQLRRSQVYRDYERAFRETTGLPLTLRSTDAFDLPHRGDPNENPFCALMARTNHTCSACLQLQKKVEEEAGFEPKTLKCFAGMCDSAVPVRVGENLIAFLQTGQILLQKPNGIQFGKAAKELIKFGVDADLSQYEEAYFQSRVVTRKQYESIVQLLTIFALHLSVLSNQLMVERESTESPAIGHARRFIVEHYSDEISLSDVAHSVNMSAYYFCKSFRKATGLTFTDYLARVRIEKVKSLLLNPHKRISEVAYESGFQSLSQFNRVFRRIAGEAPTLYRERIQGTGEH